MIGELAAFGAALSWSISAILYKEALLKAKPISANIVRLACTSVVLLLFLAFIGKFGVLLSMPGYLVVLACISGIVGLGFGDTLYMTSIKLVGVARSVPITCTYPLFNILWAILLGGEQVTPEVVLGAVTIVLGILLLSQERKTNIDKMQKKILVKGMALALATAILWSVSIAMINMAVKETPDLDHALVINTIRVTMIGIFLVASSFAVDRDLGFMRMRGKTLAAILAGGVVALGLGWFFLTLSFSMRTPVSRAVPISSTTPLFSTLSGIMFLHEKVTAKNAFGSIIIVVGIFLIFAVNKA